MCDKPENHEDLQSIPQADKASPRNVDDGAPEHLIGGIRCIYKDKHHALFLTPRRIIIARLGAFTFLGILIGVGLGFFIGDFLARRRLKSLRSMSPDDILNLTDRNFEIMHANIVNIHVKRGWSGEILVSLEGKKYKFGPRYYKELVPAIDLIRRSPLSDKLTIS